MRCVNSDQRQRHSPKYHCEIAGLGIKKLALGKVSDRLFVSKMGENHHGLAPFVCSQTEPFGEFAPTLLTPSVPLVGRIILPVSMVVSLVRPGAVF